MIMILGRNKLYVRSKSELNIRQVLGQLALSLTNSSQELKKWLSEEYSIQGRLFPDYCEGLG